MDLRGFSKKKTVRRLTPLLPPLLFIPMFLMRPVRGGLDLPEASACAGAFLLYMLLVGLVRRLRLSSVLISMAISSLIVFGLTLYISPGAVPEDEVPEQTRITGQLPGELRSEEMEADSSPMDSVRSDISARIDSLAATGGQAIRNVGIFEGSGTVGMTLSAMGDVTSATAEIFIRTIYAGSNVAREDTTRFSKGVIQASVHPLRILALFGAVLFSVAVMAFIRYLVLIERRKRTLGWYRVLVAVLVLRVAYVSLGLENLIRPAISGIADSEVFLAVSPFYALLFIFAFLNALRTQWLHYLNIWKKYMVLAGSLIVIILSQAILRVYFDGGLTICSLALGTLIGCVFTVLFVFASVTLIKTIVLLPSARMVDRRMNQLRILDGLGQSIFSTFDEDRIVSSSISLARRLSGADSSWAVRLDGDDFVPWKGTDYGAGKNVFPREWYVRLVQLLNRNEGTLLLNRYPGNAFGKYRDGTVPEIGSLLASVIRIRRKTFGILLAATHRQYGFMSEARFLMETFARQLAAAVDNSRLIETELEKERYREELAIARSIQESLLPGELPRLENLEMAGLSVPSRDVGGDYYDVFPLDDGLYGIAIADVAGKGTAAALLMAALQSALHAIAPGMGTRVAETVSLLNRVMSGRMPDGKFITFFYCVLDPEGGTIDYCCAGHDPPLVQRQGGDEAILHHGGLILGIAPDAPYESGSLKLSRGDRLILYTDGVTETMREGTEEEFGTGRLRSFLAKQDDINPSSVLENLMERLSVFRGGGSALDDMTLLLMEFTGYSRKTNGNGEEGTVD